MSISKSLLKSIRHATGAKKDDQKFSYFLGFKGDEQQQNSAIEELKDEKLQKKQPRAHSAIESVIMNSMRS